MAPEAASPLLEQSLEEHGLALYGNNWKRPVARFVGRDPHTVRDWHAGRTPVPAWALELLAYERARRRKESEDV